MKIRLLDYKGISQKFIRFCIVGGVGGIVDIAILSLLHYGLGFSPFLSRIPSALSSTVTTWCLDMKFTFGVKPKSHSQSLFFYAMVKGTGLLMNLGIYGFLIKEVPFFKAYILAALLVATGTVMLFNFTMISVVFKKTADQT